MSDEEGMPKQRPQHSTSSFLFMLILLLWGSGSARAKRTLFSAKTARTLAHFIRWTHFACFETKSQVIKYIQQWCLKTFITA